jgi:hypothetical protein
MSAEWSEGTVTTPFSALVSSSAWRAEAEAWIHEQVRDAGGHVVGALTQPRVRPWSTQLVVPTDTGRLWFKANCPALAFEAGVHAVLARLDPGEVDPPVAVDAARGWVLTRDWGTTLGDFHDPTLADWQAVVAVAAGVQRRLAEYGPELLAAGLPDCSPHTVSARFAELISALVGLPRGHPSWLEPAIVRRLRGAQGLVEDAVARLLDGPMTLSSLQHGDLHPSNVVTGGSGLRVVDFGDAQWAHPLETLAVPWGWIDRRSRVSWPDVVAAYAAVWDDVLGRAELDDLMRAAMVTQPVNRALTWLGSIRDATPEELSDWGDRPRFFLELVLEPFP